MGWERQKTIYLECFYISSGSNEVASWTNVASRIYNHGSLVKSSLDLRLILHGVKTCVVKENVQLRTNHKIEVILFDPSIEAKWIQEYTNTCLGQPPSQPLDARPKKIKLDLPSDVEESIAAHVQVITIKEIGDFSSNPPPRWSVL